MEKRNKYRLLLINPWIYDFTAFDLWSKPVGLLYLASYLEKIGYHIDYLDCLDKYHPSLAKISPHKHPGVKLFGIGPFIRNKVAKPKILEFVPRYFARYGMPEDIFISELKNLNSPDAVLLTSFMTYWYLGPKRVVEIIREIFPKAPIIFGGIYATLLPKHAHQVVKPDYVIEGPGEVKVMNLLSSILEKAPVDENPPQILDGFPAPKFDLYNQLDYLPVLTSRGCPYHCTFCATDIISGKYAQRNPEKVAEEIISGARQYKVRDIAFYDDALLLNKSQRIIPLLEKINKSRFKFRFHTPNGLHVKEINKNLAKLLFESGFKTIRLSFESVNPDRLIDMKNKVTPTDLKKAVLHLEKAGYERKSLEAYVMMGLPYQSEQEIYQSMFFIHMLGIKIRLASFSPIPGTVDYNRAVKDGLLPQNVDPLLTNKTLYPLYRTTDAYYKYSGIRQLANVLNYSADRNVNLFKIKNLSTITKKVLDLIAG